MPAIKITKLDRKCVTSDESYKWIQERLNTWQPLYNMSFAPEGDLYNIAIHTEDSVVTLFPDNGELIYELQGIMLVPMCDDCSVVDDIKEQLAISCEQCKVDNKEGL